MRYMQKVPEGWTVEDEQRWQDLCLDVDGSEFDSYAESGGLRDFTQWRERSLTDLEQAAGSFRHSSTFAEYVRPVGVVDTWAPAHLKFDAERFTR